MFSRGDGRSQITEDVPVGGDGRWSGIRVTQLRARITTAYHRGGYMIVLGIDGWAVGRWSTRKNPTIESARSSTKIGTTPVLGRNLCSGYKKIHW